MSIFPQTEKEKQRTLKMHAARDAYWAKKRAEKAAFQAENPGVLEPLSPHIQNSFNGPAKNNLDLPPKQGRPTTINLSPKEKTQNRVNKKLDKILDAQIDLATGVHYVTADGKRIYRKVPDGSTGQYLLNQLIGKPKESIEIKSTNLNLDV